MKTKPYSVKWIQIGPLGKPVKKRKSFYTLTEQENYVKTLIIKPNFCGFYWSGK